MVKYILLYIGFEVYKYQITTGSVRFSKTITLFLIICYKYIILSLNNSFIAQLLSVNLYCTITSNSTCFKPRIFYSQCIVFFKTLYSILVFPKQIKKDIYLLGPFFRFSYPIQDT